MHKRLVALYSFALSAMLTLPLLASDATARKTTSSAPATALSADQRVKLSRLQTLAAPNSRMKLARGVLPVFKATTKKKEISCGVLVYPPSPSPYAVSKILYWVNNTGQTLPPGVHIEWELEGNPPACCKGTTGPTNEPWLANPPSAVYFQSFETELNPPQPWTRPCKAWAIIP